MVKLWLDDARLRYLCENLKWYSAHIPCHHKNVIAILQKMSYFFLTQLETHIIALVCVFVYPALACAASAITWAMSHAQACTHFLLLSRKELVNRSYQATPPNHAACAMDLQPAWFMKNYNQTSIILTRSQVDETVRVIYSQTWHDDVDCPQRCHEATVNEGNLHERRCIRSWCLSCSETQQYTLQKESSHERHSTTSICSFNVSAVHFPAPILTKQKLIFPIKGYVSIPVLNASKDRSEKTIFTTGNLMNSQKGCASMPAFHASQDHSAEEPLVMGLLITSQRIEIWEY